MASVKVYTQEKKEAGTVELSSDVFEVEVRPEILNLVVRSIRASKRRGTHSAKTRAFVSGGGAKPWKQKGTGRARAGSNRSPLWRGGAVIFGPQQRDYSFKVNKKVRRLALKMALSAKYQSDTIMVLDTIKMSSVSTKSFAGILQTLEVGKVLIVDDAMDTSITLSSRNLKGVTYMTSDKLNVYEILKHKHLIIMKDAISSISARFEG